MNSPKVAMESKMKNRHVRSPEAVALQASPKGQLQYDRDWHMKPGGVKAMLEDCTCPPKLSINPNLTQSGKYVSPVLDSGTSKAKQTSKVPAGKESVSSAKSGKCVSSTVDSCNREIQQSASRRTVTIGPGTVSVPGNIKNADFTKSPSNSLDVDEKRGHGEGYIETPKTSHGSKQRLQKSRDTLRRFVKFTDKGGIVICVTPSNENGQDLTPKTKDTKVKDTTAKDDSPPKPRVSTEVALHQLEQKMSTATREAIQRHQRRIEEGFRLAQQQAEMMAAELLMAQEQELHQSYLELEEEMLAGEQQSQLYQQRLAELQHHRYQIWKARVQEATIQNQRIQKQHLEEIRTKVDQMKQKQKEINKQKDQVGQLLSTCQFPHLLPDAIKQAGDLLAHIATKVTQEIEQVGEGDEDLSKRLDTVDQLATQASNATEHVVKAVDLANKKGQEEAAARAPAVKEQPPPPASVATPAPAGSTSQAAAEVPNTLLCVSEEAYKNYARLQQQVAEIEQSYQQLVNDASLKKYKFSLQKAVNTPVNAIAPTSGAHLRDKLQKLCNLLSGQTVEVGGQQVSAAQHPACIAFCKHLLAKKIVKQGDEQVSSNHESAFAIAAVTVGVWTQFPDFGELLLAEFYTRCPFLVPYYIPKQENQSTDDYLKALGYVFEEGTVEKQDKYLRRMSGMMRLYAAIVVSRPPRGDNPHGIDKGWLWLTNCLNLEPRPDITATMMYDFLQVAGFRLLQVYGKQFVKLLKTVCDQYLPRIRRVTAPGSGGPVTRLQNLMQTVISTSSVSPPEGLLPDNFWFS